MGDIDSDPAECSCFFVLQVWRYVRFTKESYSFLKIAMTKGVCTPCRNFRQCVWIALSGAILSLYAATGTAAAQAPEAETPAVPPAKQPSRFAVLISVSRDVNTNHISYPNLYGNGQYLYSNGLYLGLKKDIQYHRATNGAMRIDSIYLDDKNAHDVL